MKVVGVLLLTAMVFSIASARECVVLRDGVSPKGKAKAKVVSNTGELLELEGPDKTAEGKLPPESCLPIDDIGIFNNYLDSSGDMSMSWMGLPESPMTKVLPTEDFQFRALVNPKSSLIDWAAAQYLKPQSDLYRKLAKIAGKIGDDGSRIVAAKLARLPEPTEPIGAKELQVAWNGLSADQRKKVVRRFGDSLFAMPTKDFGKVILLSAADKATPLADWKAVIESACVHLPDVKTSPTLLSLLKGQTEKSAALKAACP